MEQRPERPIIVYAWSMLVFFFVLIPTLGWIALKLLAGLPNLFVFLGIIAPNALLVAVLAIASIARCFGKDVRNAVFGLAEANTVLAGLLGLVGSVGSYFRNEFPRTIMADEASGTTFLMLVCVVFFLPLCVAYIVSLLVKGLSNLALGKIALEEQTPPSLPEEPL